MFIVALPVPLALIWGLVVALRNRRVPGYRPSPPVTALLGLFAVGGVALAAFGAYYTHLATEPRYRADNEWADVGLAIGVGALVDGVVIFALALAILVVRRNRRYD